MYYMPQFALKISALCNKFIQHSWIRQVQHIVCGSFCYNDIALQCQTLEALSSKLTLAEITTAPWKLFFLILFTVSHSSWKLKKIILLNFKFENIHVSKSIINMSRMGYSNENDQCAYGYPNKLPQKKNCRIIVFSVLV